MPTLFQVFGVVPLARCATSYVYGNCGLKYHCKARAV